MKPCPYQNRWLVFSRMKSQVPTTLLELRQSCLPERELLPAIKALEDDELIKLRPVGILIAWELNDVGL